MKAALTLITAIFFMVTASGQDIKQQVISSAGGYDVSADNSISVSWTLGELVISTVVSSGNELILTQGFQQPDLDVTPSVLHPDFDVDVTIYPNPTSDIINIKFGTPFEGETTLHLTGPDGRTVFNEKLPSGLLLQDINMQSFPAGTYFLRIQNGNKLNVYKVIKL